MGWPQTTWIALSAISLIVGAALDGDAKTGKHKFSVTLCHCAFTTWLVWMGGFFG